LYVKNGAAPPVPDGIKPIRIGEDIVDAHGLLTSRLDASPGAAYLLRPDQHLCARWRSPDPAKIKAARDRALGKAA
jgi:3-(3-hydroxy-phenyl)propionate hydroxylase